MRTWRREPDRRLVLALVLVVLAVSAGVRLYNLSSPSEYMFDEVYYAKDAKAILDGRMDPKRDYPWEPGDVVSWAHPDGGKLSIAVGIALFGDKPLGWRLPSVVAGLVILACVYPIARRLGLSSGWAAVAVALAASDLLGIAQSRIATLDVFVAAWTLLCIYCALRYVQDGRQARWLMLCGLAGGLGLATKWSGLLALTAAALVFLVGRRVAALAPAARTTVTASDAAHDIPSTQHATALTDAAFPPRARGVAVSVALLVVSFIVVPAAVYLASYIPYFAAGHSLAHLRELHSQMLHFNFTLSAPHSYSSAAPTWIADYRPVWYSFVDKGEYFGVVAMGNPFLWWTGAVAFVAAPVLALWRRATVPLLPAMLVAALYLPWFAASRTSFLYYMTPVAPFLAILVASTAATLLARERGAERRAVEDAVPLRELPFGGEPPRGRLGRTTDVRRFGLVAAAAVVTALAWDLIGRTATFVFWELPGRVSDAVAWATASVAIAAVMVLVAGALIAPRTRPAAVLITLGCIMGICVPFLPVVMNLGVPADRFYRLIWFPSWI